MDPSFGFAIQEFLAQQEYMFQSYLRIRNSQKFWKPFLSVMSVIAASGKILCVERPIVMSLLRKVSSFSPRIWRSFHSHRLMSIHVPFLCLNWEILRPSKAHALHYENMWLHVTTCDYYILYTTMSTTLCFIARQRHDSRKNRSDNRSARLGEFDALIHQLLGICPTSELHVQQRSIVTCQR